MTAKKTTSKAATSTAESNGTGSPAPKRPTPEEAMIAMAWSVATSMIDNDVLTDPMRMQCDLIWATRNSPTGALHIAAVKARPGLVNAVLIEGGEGVDGLPSGCQTILDEDWS